MSLELTPAMLPPDGHTSQFDAPLNNLQIGTFIAFGITFFLASLFLALRYFQAFKFVKEVEVDLVLITISYGIGLACFVVTANMMPYGWGKHLYDVSVAQLAEYNKGLLANTLTYLVSASLTKMAILAILYRISPVFSYRACVLGVALFVFTYTLALAIVIGGPCNPIDDENALCLQNAALSHAVMNIVSDVAIVMVPIPTIHGLNLSMRQKVSIGCILGLGSGVIICAIARLPYIIIENSEQDSTHNRAILGFWSMVEINLGIVCACGIRLKRFITSYLPQQRPFTSARSVVAGTVSWGKSLRMDKNEGVHSYQLHSVQENNNDILERRDIRVYRSYKIDIEQLPSPREDFKTEAEAEDDKSRDDNKSTDEILR